MSSAITTLIEQLKRHEKLQVLQPKTALLLGTGLGTLTHELESSVRIPYKQLPGFPQSTVSGHAGQLVFGKLLGTPVVMMSGRSHYYEKGDPACMRPALEVLAGIGVEKLIITNAAGSLDEKMAPGSVMLISDHINFSGANPLFGETSDERFVGMTQAYDAKMITAFERAAEETGRPLAKGVYIWFSGPSFETPAEIRMARLLGANAVGMSTVPEVILARYLGLRVAAASVITNFASGMTSAELTHKDTKYGAPLGGQRLATLLKHLFTNKLLDD